MSQPFVAYQSPFKIFLLILGSMLFVAAGLWFIGVLGSPPDDAPFWLPLIGWVSILFFGFCGVIGVRRLFDRRPAIIVDRHGILARAWSDQVIPWSAMAGMQVLTVERTKMLCIDLVDPAAHPSTTIMGKAAKLNKAFNFGDMSVATTGTDQSFDALMQAVNRFQPHGQADGA
jgi:hypothetical protein